jgi:hypothetical protein
MRTDAHVAVLRPLRDYVERITTRADDQAAAAGLTVEVGPGGVRRYRDPCMDQLAARRVAQAASGPYTGVRAEAEQATAWSTPTLTVSTSRAGARWSR